MVELQGNGIMMHPEEKYSCSYVGLFKYLSHLLLSRFIPPTTTTTGNSPTPFPHTQYSVFTSIKSSSIGILLRNYKKV